MFWIIIPPSSSVLFPGELVHILTSHTHFMKDLEERLQNWKLQGIVGDIFTKLSGSYHVSLQYTYLCFFVAKCFSNKLIPNYKVLFAIVASSWLPDMYG